MRFARLRLMGAGALVLALSLVAACGERTPTLLTVHATSTTRTAPDLAVVTLGVLARGATAREAQAAQATRMEGIMAAVRAAGVEESEVQTVGYGLEPIYAYPRNAAPRITGYQSRNTISIRVRDLTAISALIDATVSDGANELQGIQFTYLDEEASLDTARAQAVERARQRADRYAEAAGMRVARVLSITEPGGVVPPVLMDGRRMDYAAVEVRANEQSAGAISPGELDNRSSVTVVFELR
ncbi:MAG: SIMPL domain-containing protein [Hyphomonadaceae bacterium]|nr:SIMPL domain-containing protein [Hyphomonadaceae bacterium]